MISSFKKIVTALKLYKFGIVRILINKYFSGIFYYQTFLVYSYDLQNKEIDHRENQDVTIKTIEDDSGDLVDEFRKKFPAEEFVKRFKQPDQKCYIALKDGEIAGYGWIAYNELFIESINYNFRMQDDEFFIYACYVPKDHRGEGIYPAMLRQILHDSKQQDYREALIGVLSANAGSIRGIEKAGFERKDKLEYRKVLNKESWRGIEKENPKSMISNFKVPSHSQNS